METAQTITLEPMKERAAAAMDQLLDDIRLDFDWAHKSALAGLITERTKP
jgi:hypothetical protein